MINENLKEKINSKFIIIKTKKNNLLIWKQEQFGY